MISRYTVFGILLLTACVGVAAGQSTYSITVTSDETVSTEKLPEDILDDYDNIESIAIIEPEDKISAGVTVPNKEESFNVRLRNHQQGVESSYTLPPNSSKANITLNEEGNTLEKGTYAASIEQDGEYLAVAPIVVSGYEIEADIPDSTVDQGEIVRASVSVMDGDLDDASQLLIGTASAGEMGETTVDSSTSTYELELDSSSLSEGEHDLYAIVQGDEDIQVPDSENPKQVLAMSELNTKLSVTDSPDNAESSNSGDSTGGGSAGGGGGAAGGVSGGTESADLITADTGTPSISETEPSVDDSVKITAEYRNTGGEAVLEEARLLADGEPIASQEITATSGGTTSIQFTHSFAEAGQYDLAIESKTLGTEPVATITVTSQEASSSGSSSPANTDQSDNEGKTDQGTSNDESGTDDEATQTDDNSGGSTPGFGIVSTVIGVLLIVSLLVQYRRYR